MDLGLQGKKAIVCAASKGLGRACAISLAREGVELVITARTASELEATAAEIRAMTGVKVTAVAGDITSEEGRAAALAACPNPDILVNNNGGPPRGDFRDWDRDMWIKAVDANMLAPIFLIKSVIDGMIDRKFGRIVNITSGSVKSPIPELGMSNGARAGLTGFVAGLARQVAKHNVVINNILPGPFLTDRLRGGFAEASRKTNRPVDELVQERLSNTPAGRAGDPAEFGDACAFLCSAKIGFIVGQNLLLDGVEGGFTKNFLDAGKQTTIYEASMAYQAAGVPLVILAGKEYGSGSSRDWAAKGTALLGVKAVIAESFERIHRSNLIGMGVLPLQFANGTNAQSLGLTGEEVFNITGVEELNNANTPKTVKVTAGDKSFEAIVRIDTPGEADYFRHGGIMQYVLRSLLN